MKLKVLVEWTTEERQGWFETPNASEMVVWHDGPLTDRELWRIVVNEFGHFIRRIEADGRIHEQGVWKDG